MYFVHFLGRYYHYALLVSRDQYGTAGDEVYPFSLYLFCKKRIYYRSPRGLFLLLSLIRVFLRLSRLANQSLEPRP